MLNKSFETPVALFVFNRPECTQRVFDAIAKARPARLLLTADGPRPGKPGDAEACRQVREIVSHVDWPCEVSTNFAESNLGCQERMISGMNWVFSLVEEAIILEDDCLPDPSFFPFCAELLEKYRGDARVAAITGTNLVEKYLKTDASYFFSQRGGNWGWATWRSAWQRFDRHLSDWPQLRREGFLLELFGDSKPTAYWTAVFDDMHANKGRNAWDYQWVYTNLKNNALTIVPRVNLITNIGFGPGATHTTGADSRFTPPAKAMKFPLKHPASFIPLRSLDRRLEELCSMKLRHRISGKVRNIARRLQQPKKASTQSGAY